MPIEQYTESIVLQEMKCVLGENEFGFCFPQGDVEQVDKLEKALKKAGGKPSVCAIDDYSQGGNGKAKPEYVITFNKQSKTIIVVECKKSVSKHSSENLDHPKDYAVDGALYYAKFLKNDYNVIALAVSGTKKNNIKTNAYYWQKGQDEYVELKKARDVIYEPENYLRLVSGEAVKKAVSIEAIQELALAMHESLRALAVTERAKPVFIAGILIALKDNDFVKEYTNSVSFSSLLNRLQYAISTVLENSDVRKDKIKDIKSHFDRIGRIEKLKNIPLGHYNSLSWYIEELEKKIKPMMDFADNTIDALGIFYHEFVKYSGGDGSGLGIVLTPQHLTGFMCDLAGVNKNSRVVDICCGSGTFLVTAMSKMFKGADDKDIIKIRNNSLFGVESDDDIYTLAIANMIVRGDGKSNIVFGDCFNADIKLELRSQNINIGLINPPYSQDIAELEFVENMLDILLTGGIGVVVVPVSTAIGNKFKEIRERLFKRHTLKAVFSMPDDMFYSNNASTNVCVMAWEAHTPHDSEQNTFFGYYKDDGFFKAKKLGRIDKFGRWANIEKEWIELYREKEVKGGLTAKKAVDWEDEWLCEAYMATDFSKISQDDFQITVRKYLAYLVADGISTLEAKYAVTEPPAPVDTSNWHEFKAGAIFDCKTTRALISTEAGNSPYVTRSAINNGISDYVSDDNYILNKKNCITIGAEGKFAFYQCNDFVAGVKIYTLRHEKLNNYNALFVCTVLNASVYKYSYGRARILSKIKDEIIKLPIEKNGNPDWEFMEKYIKALPYSDKI
ncbi:MAG: N-6 DNA methylase [Spirochaetia bacterium]|jgi:type I restriction-modification system DNA methylase subunit|nr:N-6 DNA methylase [Spirochaetia bacterium]